MSCELLGYEANNVNVSSYVLSVMGNPCQTKAIVVPTVISYSIIFIVGTIGNICTCVVIIRTKSMHTHTNFYLLSLALSDLVVLTFGLPMELYGALEFAYPYQFPEWICKVRAYLIEFTSYASILVICSFTAERWFAIWYSFSLVTIYPIRSKSSPKISRAYLTIFVMWVVSSLAAIPIGYIVKINRLPLPDWALGQNWTYKVSDDYETTKNTEFCAMDVEKPEMQNRIIIFAFVVFFMAPAVLITMMYTHIAIRIGLSDSLLVENNKARAKSTNTVTKMLVSVVISFYLCWLPFHLQRLLSLFINYHEGNVSPTVATSFLLVYYISGCFYYTNSAINPILYNVFSENYRRAFCSTILRQKSPLKCRQQSYMKRNGTSRSQIDNSLCVRNNTSPSSRLLPSKDDCETFDSDFKTTAIVV